MRESLRMLLIDAMTIKESLSVKIYSRARETYLLMNLKLLRYYKHAFRDIFISFDSAYMQTVYLCH